MSNLVPQPHGGALSPGNPGGRGGGRPKNRIKALAAEAGFKAIGILRNRLADEGDKLSPRELSQIADMMLKYSVGTKVEVETKVVDPEIVTKATGVAKRFGLDPTEYRNALMAELEGISEWDGLELVEGTG